MAFKTIVFLVIFKYASSMPDPNVNVNVNLNVKDDDCNDCSGSCKFERKEYKVGAIIEGACYILQCMKGGDWKYLGKVLKKCHQCTVWGDPHFDIFDNHTTNGYYYKYLEDGEFTVVQNGLSNLNRIEFGVNSEFVPCPSSGDDVSCVKSVTYYEPGITIFMTIPEPDNSCDGDYDPKCAITVHVNNEKVTIGSSVKEFKADHGTVLAFRHNHVVISDQDLNCMNVVGTQGLSVSFCSYQNDYAYLYVFAMESLKSDPSNLYGLCGTYTGIGQVGYTERNGTITEDTDAFAASWKSSLTRKTRSIKRAASVNKCLNITVLLEITALCNLITKPACAVMPHSWCEKINAACIYDLCRVQFHGSYAAGYASHMAVHTHLATTSCWPRPICGGLLPPCCPLGLELSSGDTGCDCHLVFGQGCIIIPGHHADPNKACSCTNTGFHCRGDQVDQCAAPSKATCTNPGDGYCSCRQGSGNCGGYTRPFPDCGF